MGHIMRKYVFVICEQQRRRSDCASTQSDQRLNENFEIHKIAVCFLSDWLSLPGHYRVTDEALLAETT